ncbi:hypothetical protein NGM10_02755 [Halorussus salilacus]|uniref:hypothetical protein n=1 Tax=Halorussus salilacus TaxID=2953750 RepID=UPI0020A222B8|nr:hypothetical protein [Halorussus salilacus]USZ68669.1 hypothetical protein NGM10_02755 [Halorussus salilacus]
MERQDQPTGSGESEMGEAADAAPDDIAEMDITEPTVTWLEVSHPQQPIPIGERDRVLDSHFNEQYDVWEVLLVALPDEDDDDEE